MRIAILKWVKEDGIASAIENSVLNIGHTPVTFVYGERLPFPLDVVIVHGPEEELYSIGCQLMKYSEGNRPRLIVWYHEGFPDPKLPILVINRLAQIRAALSRMRFSKSGQQIESTVANMATRISGRARRLLYLGDMLWLAKMGLLTQLAVTSDWMVPHLVASGLPTSSVVFGVPLEWGANLGLERNVPVLWLGKLATRRRKRLLQRVRQDLYAKDIPILMVDGIENSYVFGEKRTILLNRTQIMLNFTRAAWDNNTQRHMLAMINRVLVISEPMPPHVPLQPGKHFISVGVEDMAGAVEYYLQHPKERNQIVEEAFSYVTTNMTFDISVQNLVRLALEGDQ